MKKLIALLLGSMLAVSAVACAAPVAPAPAAPAADATAPAPAADVAAPAADATAPAADAAKVAPTLAFICKDLSQEWFVGTSSAMLETAKARGAKDVIMFDCGMSPDKYMTALDNAIAQKVDVLIVCPPDQKLSQITVDRCAESGIKVLASDDGLINEQGIHIAPAVELDAYKVGEGIGDYLGNFVNTAGITDFSKVGYICMTMSEVSSCVPRSAGAVDKFTALVPTFPQEKIIKADYDGTTDKGFNVAAATITANPDIETWLVTAPNDEGAQGATRALEQAGKDKNATVIGVGGYLAKDEFKKEYSAFKATAYIDPLLGGKLAADAAMDWLDLDTVPFQEYKKDGAEFGVYPFSSTMVDASNYKEIMGSSAE